MSTRAFDHVPEADTFSTIEATAILAMMYSAPIVFAPIYMFHVAGTSAWISGLLAGVAGAVIVLLWATLCAAFPGRTLLEFVPEIAGRWLGWVINLVFGLYFSSEVAVSARMIAEVVHQVLPRTPLLVIIGMTLATVTVVARWGPVVLGRMAVIHLGIISLGFVGMGAGLLPLVDPGNYLPVLTEGWGALLRATARPASLFGHVVLLAFFLPLMQLHSPKTGTREYYGRALKVGMAGIGFSWLCFFVLLVFEQGVFTAPEAARLAIPALSAARAIDIGPLFERVEVALLSIWLPAVLIKTCIFLFVAALTVSHLAAVPSYRPFVVPIAGLALPASYSLAIDTPELIELINGAWTVVAIGVKAVLPLILLAVTWIQRLLQRRVHPASSDRRS